MRYFFVEKWRTAKQKAIITGSDAKHIRTVLRLKSGDKLGLFDGSGSEYEAVIDALSRDGVHVSILSSAPSTTESPVQITVAQALLKDRKMDGILRQVTELGITTWIPYLAARSVPRPNSDRLSKRMDRWHAVTREALKQCRRSRPTKIGPFSSFESILALGETVDLKVVFYEDEVKTLQSNLYRKGNAVETILVVIGPEGGFTDEEIEQAKVRGFSIVGLGPRVLKAETAAIAASSIIQFLFGDLG